MDLDEAERPGEPRDRTAADAETAIRNWMIYGEARYTDSDVHRVLAELERQVAALAERDAEVARLRAALRAMARRARRTRAEHLCPECGGEVLRIDHAMDPSTYRCRDQFDCAWESDDPPPAPAEDADELYDDPGDVPLDDYRKWHKVEHQGVAALLRRCDEIERWSGDKNWGAAGPTITIPISKVRALLGGADNDGGDRG